MKTLNSLILVAFASLLFSVPAFADKAGNGGDEVALDFSRSFSAALAMIDAQIPSLKKLLGQAKLNEVAEKATLLVVDEPLEVERHGVVQESIAMNYSADQKVLINRFRWNEVSDKRIKEAIALHEIASLAGLETTGRYPISRAYLAAVGLEGDAETVVTPECGQIEGEILRRRVGLFNMGEITRTDVDKAKVKLHKALFFRCQSITKAEYCKVALPLHADIVTGAAELVAIGQYTEDDYDEARIEQLDAKMLCK